MEKYVGHIIRIFIFLCVFSAHSLCVSAQQTKCPLNQQTHESAISMPMAAAITMDRVEISCPPSPITILHRSRRTQYQHFHPTPLCHAQSISAKKNNRKDQWRWCLIWYEHINFPPEQIAFPFDVFW